MISETRLPAREEPVEAHQDREGPYDQRGPEVVPILLLAVTSLHSQHRAQPVLLPDVFECVVMPVPDQPDAQDDRGESQHAQVHVTPIGRDGPPRTPRTAEPVSDPTIYAELNDVLRELVEGVQAILGDNLCGTYLQGSFAVGDADEHSDVDFIVATQGQITDTQLDE